MATVGANCIICAINDGRYDDFLTIVDHHPEKILTLILAYTHVDSCTYCTKQYRSQVDIFLLLNWIVFDSERRTDSFVKIFDKILQMAFEQLGKSDLTYQARFKESDGFLPESTCGSRFSGALIRACAANDITFAEKLFALAGAAGLNMSQFFTRKYRFQFLDYKLGEGFVFYLKNCKDLTEHDVIVMANLLLHRMLAPDPKHEFYTFFDLISDHKLSKQATMKYVAKNHQFFQ
jgi:hypothetical protein